MAQSYEEIQEARNAAESETRQQLQGLSRQELLEHAQKFQTQYHSLVQNGFERQGWVSTIYFRDMLHHAYPDAEEAELTAVATSLERLILDRLGEPGVEALQSDVIAADQRREVAWDMIAQRLTDEEVSKLEEQARRVIPENQLPDNFEGFKAHWLAEWVTNGVIRMPDDANGTAA